MGMPSLFEDIVNRSNDLLRNLSAQVKESSFVSPEREKQMNQNLQDFRQRIGRLQTLLQRLLGDEKAEIIEEVLVKQGEIDRLQNEIYKLRLELSTELELRERERDRHIVVATGWEGFTISKERILRSVEVKPLSQISLRGVVALFEGYGMIVAARLLESGGIGVGHNAAVVEYANEESSKRAVTECQALKLGGKLATVSRL